MPFFKNAEGFKVNGANFTEIGGDQNNYNHDQSLQVSGENNTANYIQGPYYNEGDNRTYNNGERMTVIGQGSHAQVTLGTTSMPWDEPQSQPNFGQSYGYPQANGPPPAQPYGYSAPNGMFPHSRGHLNPQFSPTQSSPPPQSQQFPNGYSPSTQPASPQYMYSLPQDHSQSLPGFGQSYGYPQANTPPPVHPHGYGSPNPMFHHSTGHLNPPHSHTPNLQPPPHSTQFQNGYGYPPSPPSTQPASPQSPAAAPYFPTHHSQTSVQSAPATTNIPPTQTLQNAHQRIESHTSGSLSPNVVPQQQSSQQSQSPQAQQSPPPPQADNQTTPENSGILSAPGVQPSPSTPVATGSVVSGTTLAPSPQPAIIVTPPVTPSAADNTTLANTASTNAPATTVTTTTAAATAVEASTPPTSSLTTQGQQTENPAPTAAPFSEFPDLKLKAGAPTPNAIPATEEKKKKKKANFFTRLFRKLFKRKSKETDSSAANASH